MNATDSRICTRILVIACALPFAACAGAPKSTSGSPSQTAPTAPSAVQLTPSNVTLTPSAQQLFVAKVTGGSDTAVTWTVDAISGGNSTVGTITGKGLYTAPDRHDS